MALERNLESAGSQGGGVGGVGKRQALSRPGAGLSLLPGLAAPPGSLLPALMSENAFWNWPAQASRVLPLLPPSSSPVPTPALFLSSHCKTKTPRSHEFRSCGQMAGASGAGCRSGTRHGSCPGPGVVLLGAAEFEALQSPRGSSVLLQGTGVQGRGSWRGGAGVGGTVHVHLCPQSRA